MTVPPFPKAELTDPQILWIAAGLAVVIAFVIVGAVITVKYRHAETAKRERVNEILSTLSFAVMAVCAAFTLIGITSYGDSSEDSSVAYYKHAYGLTVAHDHAMPDDFPGFITGTDRHGITRTYEVRTQGDGLALYGIDRHQIPAITR